jgi:hypothetical protein
MFFRHSVDKLIYPLVLVGALIAASYRPAYRLRPDMPQSFFQSTAPCGPKRPIEQKIACAYWQSAQMNIQWKYSHAEPLPEKVPPEFSIDTANLGPLASLPVTRELYWLRLKGVWHSPDTWKIQYEWNWSWASDPLDSASQWLRDTMNRVFSIK